MLQIIYICVCVCVCVCVCIYIYIYIYIYMHAFLSDSFESKPGLKPLCKEIPFYDFS